MPGVAANTREFLFGRAADLRPLLQQYLRVPDDVVYGCAQLVPQRRRVERGRHAVRRQMPKYVTRPLPLSSFSPTQFHANDILRYYPCRSITRPAGKPV